VFSSAFLSYQLLNVAFVSRILEWGFDVLHVIVIFFDGIFKAIDDFLNSMLPTLLKLIWGEIIMLLLIRGFVVFCFIGVAFILAYIEARAFILIKAFISFRQLSIECYQTPAWTQSLPHI
jgi:hypothetical protein